MICKNPISSPAGYHGCGQCLPCRFNLRRQWTHRLLLEARQHAHNSFATLTYSDENLPAGGSLEPRATRYWLDRMRKRFGYGSFRFYLCGEYGESTFRPHYHVALFGIPSCEYGNTRQDVRGRPIADCCVFCSAVHDTWGKGNIFLGGLTEESAQYIVGYVTKKMTARDDPRLGGRHPEFSRQSNRPGIGAWAAHDIASDLMKFNLDLTQADVPSALRYNSRVLPLGRYMRRKVREAIGRDASEPKSSALKRSAEMRPLREAAKASSDGSVKKIIVEVNKGRVASFEARQRIFKQRKDGL